MPTETRWYLDNRIIVSRAYGHITLDDLISLTETLEVYRQEGIAPIHWIYDMSDIEKPFLDLGAARRTFALLRHEDFGWSVALVPSNRLVGFLASTVAQLLGIRYRLVHDLDEALAFLHEHDATLPIEQAAPADIDAATS